jgi:hypothetical protein
MSYFFYIDASFATHGRRLLTHSSTIFLLDGGIDSKAAEHANPLACNHQ